MQGFVREELGTHPSTLGTNRLACKLTHTHTHTQSLCAGQSKAVFLHVPTNRTICAPANKKKLSKVRIQSALCASLRVVLHWMPEFSVSLRQQVVFCKLLESIQRDWIMADPELSSPTERSLRSPRSAPLSLSFPFLREGSHIWDRATPQPGELPSPLPTKRTRTYSATVRANAGPVFKGVCTAFSRSQGHGFIRPALGGEDIFVHISDIEGEYVPMEGDEVTYKVCAVPPKNVKVQAVEVLLTHLKPGTKHETWSGQIISS